MLFVRLKINVSELKKTDRTGFPNPHGYMYID